MQSLHQDVTLMPVLASALNELLQHFELIDAFALNKDEAVLIFGKLNEQLSIKLNTQAKTGLLFFYEHPAERSGSVFPLFKQLLQAKVTTVFAHKNNRSFVIAFNTGLQLVFKLYGPLSNLVLFEGNRVIGLFRQSIENDWLHTKSSFDKDDGGDTIILNTDHYYIYSEEAAKARSIFLRFEPTNEKLLFDTPVIFEALTFFARTYLANFLFQQKKQALINQYKQALKRQQGLFHSAQTKLQYLKTAVPPDEIANIIMANLHLLKKGETEVTLFDFYRDTNIVIKLKKDKSPQDNAAQLYKKSKNTKQEWGQAEQQMHKASLLINKLTDQLQEAENIGSAKDFKKLEQQPTATLPSSTQNNNKQQTQPLEMFKQFACMGYTILVGKNSANNDQLTLKFAHKDDLWLHARGVSGSHVVIRHKNKESAIPANVIEFAAQLAAYYSKAKSSSLVPVMYTYKKFVRKPKGALAGQVKVEKEELIMVEPRLPETNV